MIRPLSILPLVALAGCGLFDFSAVDGGAGDGGTQAWGYGKPTLEVTINGVHYGPVAPDAQSGASLVSVRDSFTGRLTSSTFRVSASASSVGSACSLNAQRYGDDVSPIGAAAYQFSAGGGTPQGTVAPIEGESASSPLGTWYCSGSGCGGSTLVLSVVDSTHVEGYFAGTLPSLSGGSRATVVCSFYLPWTAYRP